MVSASFSGGFLPIVMLIIIPIIDAIVDTLSLYNTSVGIFLDTFGFIGIFILIAQLAFGLYPLRFSTEKYVAKRGYENTVMELQFIKTLLLIVIPILSIVLIIRYYLHPIFFTPVQTKNILLQGVDESYSILPLIAIVGFLRITSQILKKEFRFYFAKACFIIVSKQEDDYKKRKA